MAVLCIHSLSVISHSFHSCTHIVQLPADISTGYGPSYSVIRLITRRNPLHAFPPHALLTRSHCRSSTNVIELCIRTLDRRQWSDDVAPSQPRRHFSVDTSAARRPPYSPSLVSISWSAIPTSATSSVFCVLTVSDGSDSPPYLRVFGSSAPPRL